MRLARRLLAVIAALVAVLAVGTTAAHADDTGQRERLYSRVTVIMTDAIEADIYNDFQRAYVAGAIIPGDRAAGPLPARTEGRNIDAFWSIVTDDLGMSQSQVRAALRAKSTLGRLAGSNYDDLSGRLAEWLGRPAFQARLSGDLTYDEFQGIRSDIDIAVKRLLSQQGGIDYVNVVRAKN